MTERKLWVVETRYLIRPLKRWTEWESSLAVGHTAPQAEYNWLALLFGGEKNAETRIRLYVPAEERDNYGPSEERP